MTDRNVLDLALEDQQQARDRIEELRQQITEQEARIEAIDGFVETYREYEQRLGGDASNEAATDETASSEETVESGTVEAESNGATYATPYSSYRP